MVIFARRSVVYTQLSLLLLLLLLFLNCRYL